MPACVGAMPERLRPLAGQGGDRGPRDRRAPAPQPPSGHLTDPPPILAGLRVVEVSAFVAAPLGGMTLAQLGADVIRIASLAGKLDYRRWPVTADDVSHFWCGLDKSKRSVALDLTSAAGRELAMALICAAGEDGGILLTDLPPRGWFHEALRARRPDATRSS